MAPSSFPRSGASADTRANYTTSVVLTTVSGWAFAGGWPRTGRCRGSVWSDAVAYVVQLELEPIHDAKDGSIRGLRETRLGMAQRSDAMNAALIPNTLSMDSSASGNRSASEAAGASRRRTGSSVVSLTKKAACGREKMAVAYQFPKTVVGCSTMGTMGCFTRSSSFLVPWIV